jgi:hypothetical protein
MLHRLPALVNDDDRLVERGRFVNTTFLVEVGPQAWLVAVSHGRVADVTPGPFVMPRWTFALRASEETWEKFWSPNPPPGFHDLMAMIKFRTLRAEGDLYPFMSNLLWFKAVLATPRSLTTNPTPAPGGLPA